MNNESRLTASPRKILATMLIVIFALVAANIAGIIFRFWLDHDYVFGFVPLFDLDNESNIPTAYSALQILFASLLLSLIGVCKKSLSQSYLYWLGLSFIMLFLAFDELFQIHERLSIPVDRMLPYSDERPGAWALPYGWALLAVGAFLARFLTLLPKKTVVLFVLSGLLYIGGAIGVDTVGGFLAAAEGRATQSYALVVTCEETMELLGIAFFCYALLLYAEDSQLELHLVFRA